MFVLCFFCVVYCALHFVEVPDYKLKKYYTHCSFVLADLLASMASLK